MNNEYGVGVIVVRFDSNYLFAILQFPINHHVM